jgi:hypothetical protein
MDGIQNTTGLNPTPVNNGLSLPPGINPSVIPLNIDCTVNQSVLVDFTQQVQGGHIGPIQTIFVNNSGNSQPVTVVTNVLNQQYVIPGGESAILPILLPPQSPKLTVSTTGGVIVPIAVMNFPLAAQVWGGSSGGSSTVGNLTGLNTYDVGLNPLIVNLGLGKGLSVYDLALQALISNQGSGNGLDVNVISGGEQSSINNQLIINGELTAGTTQLSSAAAGANLFWAVTGIDIGLTNDIALSAGGVGAVTIFSPSGGTYSHSRFNYPTASGNITGQANKIISCVFDPPIIPTGMVNDNVVRAQWDDAGAPTSGGAFVNVWGYPQSLG